MIIQTKVITNYDPSKIIFHCFSDRLRPRSIDELTIPSAMKRRFNRMRETRNFQNLLFYGSPGIGKSSCADLLVDGLDDITVRRFNAGVKRDVFSLSEIRNYSSTIQLFSNTKVFILDEIDNLSEKEQKMLLSTIEEGSIHPKLEHSSKFILLANNVKRLIDPLKSRCLPICFDLMGHDLREAKDTVIKTAASRFKELDAEIDLEKVRLIVDRSFPDFRTIANRLEFELL